MIAKFLGCKGSHRSKSQEALSAVIVKEGKGRNPGDPLRMETVWEEASRKTVISPSVNGFKLN